MTTWEVSLISEENSRYVLAREVDTSSLYAYIAAAFEEPKKFGIRQPSVMVTRTDQTPEAKQAHWEAEFYDIVEYDRKDGRHVRSKRRRYKPSQIERDWVAMIERDKKQAREYTQAQNIHQGREA